MSSRNAARSSRMSPAAAEAALAASRAAPLASLRVSRAMLDMSLSRMKGRLVGCITGRTQKSSANHARLTNQGSRAIGSALLTPHRFMIAPQQAGQAHLAAHAPQATPSPRWGEGWDEGVAEIQLKLPAPLTRFASLATSPLRGEIDFIETRSTINHNVGTRTNAHIHVAIGNSRDEPSFPPAWAEPNGGCDAFPFQLCNSADAFMSSSKGTRTEGHGCRSGNHLQYPGASGAIRVAAR